MGKKKVTSPDPDYVVKRERVEKLKDKAEKGSLSSHDSEQTDKTEPAKAAQLVYCDSTDLHWCPEVSQTYSAVGEQVKVV